MNYLIKTFDTKYLAHYENLCELNAKMPSEKLFWKPRDSASILSVGEYILRSAGKVEQTFGGITTRLWDDPFEWTLPEELSTNEKILEYLNEVEQTRRNGFKFFTNDEDLKKELPAPEQFTTLFDLLLETLIQAENLRGWALAVYKILSAN